INATFHDLHSFPTRRSSDLDIKDSSVARNEAIQKDLIAQLDLVSEIFIGASKQDSLPIYEEYNFRIKSFLKEVREDFQTSSEQRSEEHTSELQSRENLVCRL